MGNEAFGDMSVTDGDGARDKVVLQIKALIAKDPVYETVRDEFFATMIVCISLYKDSPEDLMKLAAHWDNLIRNGLGINLGSL